MAKFLPGIAVSAISGSEGGTTFSRNASGAYFKGKVMPVNPNTAKQQAVRNSFAINVAAWKNLTIAQQQEWIDIAPQYPYNDSLGQSKQYTGQQLFNKLNQNLSVTGSALLTSPKVPQTFSTTKVASLTMTLTAGVLTTGDLVLDAVGAATEKVIVIMTVGQSGGITRPGKSSFRQVMVVADASASATIDVIAAYQALYGDPEIGVKVFARAYLVNVNTGQKLALGQAVAVTTGT